MALGRGGRSRVSSTVMREWRQAMFGGKRASDRQVPAPARAVGATARLKQAIRRDRIELRFQPQIEPASGRIVGVEALARWDGADSPEELFARAEAAGLSERLSRVDPAQGAAHRRRLGAARSPT